MSTFVERLETLALLSQNYETADAFTSQYSQLLGEIFNKLQLLRELADIQVEWLQGQAGTEH